VQSDSPALTPAPGRPPEYQQAANITAATTLLPHALTVSGWRVFHRADIEIAALSARVACFVVASSGAGADIGPRRAGCFRAGLAIAVLTVIQIL
jgi:hypothetical protein